MRRAIAVLSAVFAVLLSGAPPAAAHGGKIKLEVAGDGATGVTVRALYQSDGHAVEDKVLRLTLTATGEGGRTAGPLDLNPAPEGRGFYSSGGVLTPGRWTVVVAATDPNVIRSESTVEARAPQQAAPVQTTPPAPPPTTSGSADRAGPDSGEGGGGAWWTFGFVVALALTAAVVLRVRRRRTVPTGTPRSQARQGIRDRRAARR